MFKLHNGPIYITIRFTQIPSCGTLIDSSYIVNVIIEKHISNKGMHRDTFDTTPVWIQTCNDFLYHPQGSITLLVTLSRKAIYTKFFVIPTSNQFQVKFGISWISFMQHIDSPIHKCLKFPHNGEVSPLITPFISCHDLKILLILIFIGHLILKNYLFILTIFIETFNNIR